MRDSQLHIDRMAGTVKGQTYGQHLPVGCSTLTNSEAPRGNSLCPEQDQVERISSVTDAQLELLADVSSSSPDGFVFSFNHSG